MRTYFIAIYCGYSLDFIIGYSKTFDDGGFNSFEDGVISYDFNIIVIEV